MQYTNTYMTKQIKTSALGKGLLFRLLVSWWVSSCGEIFKTLQDDTDSDIDTIEPVQCLLYRDSLAQISRDTSIKLLRFLGDWSFQRDTLGYTPTLIKELTQCNQWWKMTTRFCDDAKEMLDMVAELGWFEYRSCSGLDWKAPTKMGQEFACISTVGDWKKVWVVMRETRDNSRDNQQSNDLLEPEDEHVRLGEAERFIQSVHGSYVMVSDERLSSFDSKWLMNGVEATLQTQLHVNDETWWNLFLYVPNGWPWYDIRKLRWNDPELPVATREKLQDASCLQYEKGLYQLQHSLSSEIRRLENQIADLEDFHTRQCPYGFQDPFGKFGDIENLRGRLKELQGDLALLDQVDLSVCDVNLQGMGTDCFQLSTSGLLSTVPWCESKIIWSLFIYSAQWATVFQSKSVGLPFDIAEKLSSFSSWTYYIKLIDEQGTLQTLIYIKG